MARNKKGPAARPATLWEQAEEVPRAGIPDTDKLAKRMRLNRWVIWLVLLAFPVLVLSLFVTASSLKAAAEEKPAVVEVDADARAVAMTAVEDWLAGDPAPLPGGKLVSWDEMEALPAFVPGPQDGDVDPATIPDLQSHTLTVRDGAGVRYVVQVLVAKNRLGELAVVGTPSLTPVAPSSEWATGVSPWPNHDGTQASEPVETAVVAWADAFASGDPGKLRLVIGDPDADHAYQPMVGVVGASTEITGAAWVTDEAGEPTSTMLVQVQVRFTWPDTDPRRGGAAAATYDLLVEGADSAAPRVVAWGGVGTGPVLKAYQNAVEGRELRAVEQPEVTVPEDGQTAAPATGEEAGAQTQDPPTGEADVNEPAPDGAEG